MSATTRWSSAAPSARCCKLCIHESQGGVGLAFRGGSRCHLRGASLLCTWRARSPQMRNWPPRACFALTLITLLAGCGPLPPLKAYDGADQADANLAILDWSSTSDIYVLAVDGKDTVVVGDDFGGDGAPGEDDGDDARPHADIPQGAVWPHPFLAQASEQLDRPFAQLRLGSEVGERGVGDPPAEDDGGKVAEADAEPPRPAGRQR